MKASKSLEVLQERHWAHTLTVPSALFWQPALKSFPWLYGQDPDARPWPPHHIHPTRNLNLETGFNLYQQCLLLPSAKKTFVFSSMSFWQSYYTLTPALKGYGGGLRAAANFTWCGCKGRRSTTPLQPSELLWAKLSGTSWECACQCGRPCGCTGLSHQVHLCRACFPRSPRRYLHRSSLLGSFSARGVEKCKRSADTVVWWRRPDENRLGGVLLKWLTPTNSSNTFQNQQKENLSQQIRVQVLIIQISESNQCKC